MALRVWLPLSGDTTTNYGLSDASGVAVSAAEPITPVFGNSILGGRSLTVGSNGVAVKADIKMSLAKFTVSFWVKEGTNSAGAVLFALQDGNTDILECVKGAEGYSISKLSNEVLFSLTLGWNHIAITADGAKVKVYVNGSLTKEVAQSNSIVVGNNATITITFGGKFVSDAIVQSWSGSLCDAKLFDSVISLFEAVAMANAMVINYGFNGKMSLGSSLIAADFPEGTDAEFYEFGAKEYDLSGNEFDGTYGTVKPVAADDTPMYSSSFDFTSADDITVTMNTSEFINRYTVSIWAKGTGNAVTFSNGGSIVASDATKWHNIVVTSNGKRYIDGVEDTEVQNSLIGSGNCTITIGGAFSGKLSDFRIYAKQMTADEVVALYKRKAAIDNSGKLIASEIVVDDGVTAPSFSKSGVVSAAAMNNWTGESESPVDVTTFSILQASSAINASDIIEF